MGALMREVEFVEDLVQAGGAQAELPLLRQQRLDVARRPLIGIEAIIGRRFVEQDVAENLAALWTQGLRTGSLLRREQGVEASVEIGIQPFLQGFALNPLDAAGRDHALAVPNGFQGQQSTSSTLLLMAVKQHLPLRVVLRGPSLNAVRAVHHGFPERFHLFSSPLE